MRLRLLHLQRWPRCLPVTVVIRFLPYVLLIVGLKVYFLSLLLSSSLVARQSLSTESKPNLRPQGENSLFDGIPRKQEDLTTPTTQEPHWQEKQEMLRHLHDAGVDLIPSATNRTPTDTIWLFYNRIPRSGGKTLVALLHALGVDLDFQHQEHTYRTPWQRLMTAEEQRNLATWFEYNFWPKSYDRLALFINFSHFHSSYERQRPVAVTMLRDPVEMFMSQFHHKRTDPDSVKRNIALRERLKLGSGRTWYWLDLNACILHEDEECSLRPGEPDFERSVPFLCGQHERCIKREEQWALQRAKYMAEYEYAVVGILEDFNMTLGVLEHYVPAFFHGARQRYWSDEFAAERVMNKQPRRVKALSAEARRVLRRKLGLEYELYEFCRQRLARQHEQVLPLLNHTTPLPPAKGPSRQELSVWERFQMELNL